MSVSQSSALCLYTLRPVSDRSERTFVLLRYSLGGPPQSNCPPYTVLDPDYGPELEPQACQGGISRMAPRELASTLQSLPPILHSRLKVQCKATVKVHGVFRLAADTLHLHSDFNFTESRVETAPPSLRHSCRSELTRQGISLPRTVIVTAAVYRASIRASLANPIN